MFCDSGGILNNTMTLISKISSGQPVEKKEEEDVLLRLLSTLIRVNAENKFMKSYITQNLGEHKLNECTEMMHKDEKDLQNVQVRPPSANSIDESYQSEGESPVHKNPCVEKRVELAQPRDQPLSPTQLVHTSTMFETGPGWYPDNNPFEYNNPYMRNLVKVTPGMLNALYTESPEHHTPFFGYVKRMGNKFGFLQTPSIPGQDIFVHVSDIVGDPRNFKKGVRVAFEFMQIKRQEWKAVNVRMERKHHLSDLQ
jgi:cold shock CspA family protein